MIWKGTSEEKARKKWVDGLEGLLEEESQGQQELDRRKAGLTASRQGRGTPKPAAESSSSGPGFFRRLKDEIYME